MKTKKQTEIVKRDPNRSDPWQDIRERRRLPDFQDGESIKTFFAYMHKNNRQAIAPPFTIFPSVVSSPNFVRYSFRNTVFLVFFLRDLSLTQPHVFSQYKEAIKVEYNRRKVFSIIESGEVESVDKFSRPASPSVFCALAYFLGFTSVNYFYIFLDDLYTKPYECLIQGIRTKRGQPWFCLNYEDGASGQGRNDDEEHNNTDI